MLILFITCFECDSACYLWFILFVPSSISICSARTEIYIVVNKYYIRVKGQLRIEEEFKLGAHPTLGEKQLKSFVEFGGERSKTFGAAKS